MNNQIYLSLSWSTSKGRETYGYNICRLDANDTDKRYKCIGGGYDMTGTVFADWLQDRFQDRLKAIGNRAKTFWKRTGASAERMSDGGKDALYGMTAEYAAADTPDNYSRIRLDGACGLECMLRIAESIGLEVTRTHNRKGHTTGFIVSDTQTA